MTVSTAMSTAMNANIAIDVVGRTIKSLCANGCGADARARPCPLEVETADPAVDVENLADQKESGPDPRRHRGRIDLVERHASSRHLGVVVAARALDGERPTDQRVDETPAVVSCEMRERRTFVDCKAAEEGGRCRLWDEFGERLLHRGLGMRCRASRPPRLDVLERLAGTEAECQRRAPAVDHRAEPVPRHIERDGPADAEVRPE